MQVLADRQWDVLEPLLNEVRPWAARPIQAFRRTIEAIVWRQQNGAKWRSIPAELGPWWRAAQTFIRWARLGVWERMHRLVQEHCGRELGMVFLDGTVIRAHQKAAGAQKQGRTPEASAAAQALGRSRGGYGTRIRHRRAGRDRLGGGELIAGLVDLGAPARDRPAGAARHVGRVQELRRLRGRAGRQHRAPERSTAGERCAEQGGLADPVGLHRGSPRRTPGPRRASATD